MDIKPSQDPPQEGPLEPAKKQSKWSPEEDAKIIRLRSDDMKWADISTCLPGRSALSCRLHYQNYLQKDLKGNEELRSRLAMLYESSREGMWSGIAKELHIHWRTAEALHREIGGDELAQRAGGIPFAQRRRQNAPEEVPRLPGIDAMLSGIRPNWPQRAA